VEDIDAQLEEFIFEKTEGIPFFIEEFVRSLRNLNIIERTDGRYSITKDIKDVSIPSTVQDVIMARIDSLPEGMKSLLQTGSVIGREFSSDLIKGVTGLSEFELHSQLSGLRDAELLYERGIYPQSTFIFKHALTQEVAYNSLLQRKRKEIHESVGRAIEELYPERIEEYCDLLAYQYSHSDNKEKAVQYSDRANQKAAKVCSMQEAMAYFDQAMDLLDTLPESEENRRRRISLLVNNVIVFQLQWKFPEYHDLLKQYEPIAVGLDNPELLGAFYTRLGHIEWGFALLDQSIQTLTKAVELNEASGNAEDAGYAYMVLQWAYLLKGDYDLTITYKEDAIRMMEQQFNLRWYLWAIAATSLAYTWLGRWDDAVEEGQKELEVAEEYSDNSMICFAHWVILMAYAHKGDLDRAVEHGEVALEKAPTPADEVWAQLHLCLARCRAGETLKAIEILSQLVSLQRAVPWIWSEVTALFLGEGYYLAGEYDKAKQTLKEVLEIQDQKQYGMKFVIGSAHRLLGEIAMMTNPNEASSHFEQGIEMLSKIKAENELALAYAGYGRFHKQKGDIAQARDYLNRALEIFERLGTLIEPDKVRQELAELSAD
jgi:tetratricopeptide (TPR) repeat protein